MSHAAMTAPTGGAAVFAASTGQRIAVAVATVIVAGSAVLVAAVMAVLAWQTGGSLLTQGLLWLLALAIGAGMGVVVWIMIKRYLTISAWRIVVGPQTLSVRVPASMTGPRTDGGQAEVPLSAIRGIVADLIAVRWTLGWTALVKVWVAETADGRRIPLGCYQINNPMQQGDSLERGVEAAVQALSARTGLQPLERDAGDDPVIDADAPDGPQAVTGAAAQDLRARGRQAFVLAQAAVSGALFVVALGVVLRLLAG